MQTSECVCVCVCKGYNRHNYLCLRGPVMGGLVWRGGVQQWPHHGLCVYRAEGWQVSAIIDYLHTATHACSRALNTEMYTLYRHRHHSPKPFFSFCVHLTHTHTDTHAGWAFLQCISISVSISVKGRDGRTPASSHSLWQNPGPYLTLQARLCQDTTTGRLVWKVCFFLMVLLLKEYFS